MRTLIELLRRLRRLPVHVRRARTLAALNCRGHEAARRKPPARRCAELLVMALRWGEPSLLYYAQQLDLKGRRLDEFLSYARFRHLRDLGNRVGPRVGAFDYACLFQDKLVFSRYFGGAGLAAAPVLGTLSPGLVARFPADSPKAVDFWPFGRSELRGRELFCKPRDGLHGAGVFLLRFTEDALLLDGRSATLEEVAAIVRSECVVQPRIAQHRALAAFHESSLNTLRLVTFRTAAGIELFLAYFRMGSDGGILDNDNAARVLVRVDAANGRLHDTGYAIRDEIPRPCDAHPTTSRRFAGSVIPDFCEACELAIAAHALVPAMQSVGWDVAITPEGPVLIEGNENWGATTAMWAMPDFSRQFLARTAPSESGAESADDDRDDREAGANAEIRRSVARRAL